MGGDKNARIERQEAEHQAAERDGRLCPYCSAVIPYGTDPGPHGECPACVGPLKND